MDKKKSDSAEEILLIGPTVPLWPEHQTCIPNQKPQGANTVELIFAPWAAAITIVNELGEEIDYPFANAGYNPNEPRVPAGKPVGGQWTAAGTGEAPFSKMQGKIPPPELVLSGGNDWRLGESLPDLADSGIDPITWGEVARVWKGYGEAITETVRGIWNSALHPITTVEGIGKGVSALIKDPGGVLKAIGQQIAEDFTGGDLRKAGKLVGLALVNLATGAALGKLAPLLQKVPLAPLVQKVVAAASGKPVRLTAEEAEIVDKAFLQPYRVGRGHHVPAQNAFLGEPAYNPQTALAIPKAELEIQGVKHTVITVAQQALYRAFAKTGQPLTWDAMQSIETQALVKGGMKPLTAQAIVTKAINALKAAGVKGPTKIPWGGK